MAIAFDSASNGTCNYTANPSITFSHTCGTGANTILFVAVQHDTTASATYNGSAMTQLDVVRSYDTAGAINTLFYIVLGTGDGTAHNVVVTVQSGGHYVSACSASYTGVDQTNPIDAHSAENASNDINAQSAPWSSSITSTVDGCWAVANITTEGGNPTNAGTGTTKRALEPNLRSAGIFDNGGAKTPAGAIALQITGWSGSRNCYAVKATLKPAIDIPTVTTSAVTNKATTSGTGNGEITATGGANATRRGFCYKAGSSGDPTTSDSVVYDDGDYGTGTFNKSITGLSSATEYRVRAYAVNSAGTGYGSTVSYTTSTAYSLITQVGAFILTGINVSFKRSWYLSLQVGQFTLTGINIGLGFVKKLITSVGQFTLTGIDANFRRLRNLIAGTGDFVLTGIDVNINKILKLIVSVGIFTLTGINVCLKKVHTFTVEAGQFVLTGIDVSFIVGKRLIARVGSFVLSGLPVIFRGTGSWKWIKQSKGSSNFITQNKNSSSWIPEDKNN